MYEYYHLPVQMTPEERSRYAAWGIKKEKTLLPFLLLVLLLDLAVTLGTLYVPLGLRAEISQVSLFLRLYGKTFFAFSTILFFVLVLLLWKPLDLLCDRLLRRPKDPRMLRLEPCPEGVQYQLFRQKDLLSQGVLSWEQWDTAVFPAANQIWIEGECLTIGANTIQSIYPKEKQHPWMDHPAEKIVGFIRLEEVQNNLDGYLASLEEQKREEEWLAQHPPEELPQEETTP